ncbi:MAG: hypothetical protein QOF48_1145 [Verrucomicrobiota bacterium]
MLPLLMAAGCEREQIRVYTVPKDKPAAVSTAPVTVRPRPVERPQLEWKLPPGWREGAPGQMSVANFSLPAGAGEEAEVSITPLPLMKGRETMIVNMWREQVGLEPLSEEDARKEFQTVDVGGENASLFELSGKPDGAKPKRIVTVMLHRSDSSWFYKLSGDAALVEAQKPAFIEFLKSVRVKSQPGLDTPPFPTAATTKFNWQVPAQWKQMAAGEMQVARFAVPERAGAKAEVFVSVFGSDTGGTLANVNRWRRELGLRDVDDAGLPPIVASLDPAEPGARLVDLTNDNRRLVAAIVPREGSYWFYKLRGDAAAVGPERDAFVAFVKSKP